MATFIPIFEKESSKKCESCGKILNPSKYKSKKVAKDGVKGLLRSNTCIDCKSVSKKEEFPEYDGKYLKEIHRSIDVLRSDFTYSINKLKKEIELCRQENKELKDQISEMKPERKFLPKGIRRTRRMTLPFIHNSPNSERSSEDFP